MDSVQLFFVTDRKGMAKRNVPQKKKQANTARTCEGSPSGWVASAVAGGGACGDVGSTSASSLWRPLPVDVAAAAAAAPNRMEF